jgi:hypothetical protein
VADLIFENHGSVWLLRHGSEAGKEWMEGAIPEDAPMLGDAVAIEHRFVSDIAVGAWSDGLDVEVKQ